MSMINLNIVDPLDIKGDLDKLGNQVFSINEKRGYHNKSDIGGKRTDVDKVYLTLVLTELSEVVEADRRNKRYNFKDYNREIDLLDRSKTKPELAKVEELFRKYVKDTIEDEFADVVIRLMDYAKIKDVELTTLYGISSGPKFCRINSLPDNIFYICQEIANLNTKQYIELRWRIPLLIGMIFQLAYWYDSSINLMQHIEMKIDYNSIQPKSNNKKY